MLSLSMVAPRRRRTLEKSAIAVMAFSSATSVERQAPLVQQSCALLGEAHSQVGFDENTSSSL
jgi:hypothetical protein